MIIHTPGKGLNSIRQMMKLFKEGGITGSMVARVYEDAFQITLAHSDAARAKIFAERACAIRKMAEGSDSHRVINLERVAQSPALHPIFGLSHVWKTTLNAIPRDLSGKRFDNWLWRMNNPVASLQDSSAYPLFVELPGLNDLHKSFWECRNGVSFRPKKHWCLLAEINEVFELENLVLQVRDRSANCIPIVCNTEHQGREYPEAFQRKGFTVAVMYAEKFNFEDSSAGIKLENSNMLRVSCDRLMDNNERMGHVKLSSRYSHTLWKR